MPHMDDTTRQIHQVAADLLRQQDRARKPLARRLKEALSRAALLSGAPAAQASDTGKLHAAKAETQLPAGVTFTTDGDIAIRTHEFRLESYLAPIEHHVERLERAIDAELGLSEERHHVNKSGAELDSEILAWAGTPSHVVATKAPWLGSPRTIERVRLAHGVRPSDGTERPLKAA